MDVSDAPERLHGLPFVGMAIIAKDEEEGLGTLLDSLGWTEKALDSDEETWRIDGGAYRPTAAVDFVVVCDTGSTDRTKEVARERGCKVVDFEWVDDFSKARQASWDALPDWIEFGTWADCDDVIVGAEKIRAVAAQMPDRAVATLHPYDYATDEVGNVTCYLERERIIRMAAGCSWHLPVHECLNVPPAALIRCEDVKWVHRREEMVPTQRNYKILLKAARDARKAGKEPDARTVIYLGSEALAYGKHKTAVKYLRQFLAQGTFDEEVCQANHKLSIALRGVRDEEKDEKKRAKLLDESEAAAQAAVATRPDWADGYLDLAEIASVRKDWKKMLRWAEIAGERDVPTSLLIVSPLDYEYLPLLQQSIALTQLGETEKALEATEKVLKLTPYREDVQNQLAGLANKAKVEQTVRQVLSMRELLCRHDENLKALRLLENVPYYAQDHPLVAEALRDQREMVLHATDPETYTRYYGANPNEAPFEMQQIPIEDAHKQIARLAFLREGLEGQAHALGRKSLKVLDLSGNDGWMIANLSLAGHECDMLELNKDAAKRADERRAEYPKLGRVVNDDLHRAGEHFEEGGYDAVVCFETIEHVPDPERMLDVMASMCKPGGNCYVSTPNGAYEYGNVPGWAVVEHKGHLRAITPQELSGWITARGIIEGFIIGPDRVQVCGWRPSPRKGKVVFYAGNVDPQPEKILEGGQGGSETALCKMAELFARRGYEVKVYASESALGLRGDQITIDEQEALDGQVFYGSASEWNPGEECDLFVSSRRPDAFDRSIAAKETVLWLHDAEYGEELTEERALRAGTILAMSEFQKVLLRRRYDFLQKAKVHVTRNGIEPKWFKEAPKRKKPWVVYSSSPDRGLDVLLECWPAIKKAVPDAELHHTYAPVYQQFAQVYPHLQKLSARIAKLSEADGVVAHSNMGQRELAELFLASKVWAYPSFVTWADEWFPEISCISAMEAQAGGCIPVTSGYAALKETVVCGLTVEPAPLADLGVAEKATDATWQKRFTEAVVRALKSAPLLRECREKGREYALDLGWEGVADEWEQLFLSGAKARSAALESSLHLPAGVQ
jgi:2-polyprenyl-3-methyl-5-hydroxy-6-metoxy-1,4-benzoquinol methylase/glycosyltransferase involved in cell wall biosynthesis